MAMESGSWKIRVACRGCGRTADLWLDDIPVRYRYIASLTPEAVARMRRKACGMGQPSTEVYWAQGAFKRPRR